MIVDRAAQISEELTKASRHLKTAQDSAHFMVTTRLILLNRAKNVLALWDDYCDADRDIPIHGTAVYPFDKLRTAIRKAEEEEGLV